MTATIEKYHRKPVDVDAAEYTGRPEDRAGIIEWIAEKGGLAFPAAELHWRNDMATYWHPVHGFVYLPQGARSAGSALQKLQDNELVVRNDRNIFVLVFPGDYVVRSRSGFYPLEAESFHRSYVSYNPHRRGLPHRVPPAS